MLPLIFFFGNIFHPVFAVYGCQDKGLESLVKKGFLSQKQNEFQNCCWIS